MVCIVQVRYITVALQNSIFNKNSLKRVLLIFMPFVVFPVLLPFLLPFPYQYFCQSKYRVNVYISSRDTHVHLYISSTGKTINCFYTFFGGVVSASLILYWYLKKKINPKLLKHIPFIKYDQRIDRQKHTHSSMFYLNIQGNSTQINFFLYYNHFCFQL